MRAPRFVANDRRYYNSLKPLCLTASLNQGLVMGLPDRLCCTQVGLRLGCQGSRALRYPILFYTTIPWFIAQGLPRGLRPWTQTRTRYQTVRPRLRLQMDRWWTFIISLRNSLVSTEAVSPHSASNRQHPHHSYPLVRQDLLKQCTAVKSAFDRFQRARHFLKRLQSNLISTGLSFRGKMHRDRFIHP